MWSSNTIQLKWSIFTLKTYYDRWNHPVSDFDLLLLSFILFCHNIFQNTITSIPRLLSFSSFWGVCYILLFWTCFLFFNWSFFRKIHACVFAFAPMEKNVTWNKNEKLRLDGGNRVINIDELLGGTYVDRSMPLAFYTF